MSKGLGPLPEGREYMAGTNRHFAKVCGTVTAYSADDMLAYALREVAAERERCAKILDLPPGTEAWEVIGGEEGLTMLRELAAQIRGA